MLNSRKIELMHWMTQLKYWQLVKKCKDRDVEFLCVGTVRDQFYQDYIYQQGRSRKGNIVTNAKYTTFHRDDVGLAFDLCPLVNGKLDWNADREYKIIQEEARKLGFTCGIDWKSFPENAHFQLDDGLTAKDILAGKRPRWFYDKPNQDTDMYSKLIEIKIIGAGGFDWKNACENNQQINGEYAKALLVNFYKYKTKKYSFTMTEVINYLFDNKVLSDKDYWLNGCQQGQFVEGQFMKIVIDKISKLV